MSAPDDADPVADGADGQPAATGVDVPSADVSTPAEGETPAAPSAPLAALVETLDAAEAKAALAPPPADAAPEVAPDVSDLPPAELRAVVEALLFVATRPLTIDRLLQCLPGTSERYLERFLDGLAARYDHENRGWELRRIANGWQLLTRRAHYPWVRQLERKELPSKLSRSALETLAIVAYKQPISRAQVAAIRGVNVDGVMRTLQHRGYVTDVARDPGPGQAVLYGTTPLFLERLGLDSLDQLPPLGEFVPNPDIVEALEQSLRPDAE